MKLTILGATGYVGKVLLAKAIEAGYQIRVLVRDPGKLGEYRERVDYIVGDALDAGLVGSVVTGAAAVLSTIAPPQRNPGDPYRYEQVMKNIINAMKTAGIKRLIHIGGAGYAVVDGEQWTFKRRFLRGFLLLGAKPILAAKNLEWQVLKNSGLDWTLVRPPAILPAAPRGTLVADEQRLWTISVNLQDLADFMLQQIAATQWIRRAPLVSSRALKQKELK